jgi:RNA polymerase sigma-70 factor (ECF subfamily)
MSELRETILDQIPALRRYSLALVRDRDSAADLVQDALVRAIRAEHQWQPGTNLRAWLFTILHNVFAGDRRQYARRPVAVSIDAEAWHLAQPSNQVSRVALGELDRAIATLPEHQRMTLLLVALEGMAYAEAAQIMGVPVGTIRSRLSRARRSLQQLLAGDDDLRDGTAQRRGAKAGEGRSTLAHARSW